MSGSGLDLAASGSGLDLAVSGFKLCTSQTKASLSGHRNFFSTAKLPAQCCEIFSNAVYTHVLLYGNNHRLRSATPFHIKCHLILRNVGHHVDHIEMAERLKNLFLLAGTLPNAPQTSHLLGNCFHAGHPGWEPTLALVQ